MGPLSACACGWTLKKERRHCLGTAGTLLCKVATKEELHLERRKLLGNLVKNIQRTSQR